MSAGLNPNPPTMEQLHQELQRLQHENSRLAEALQRRPAGNVTPDELVAQFHRLQEQVTNLNALSAQASKAAPRENRIKLPLPEKYSGQRKAETIDEFIAQSTRYLASFGVTEKPEAVTNVATFLKGKASKWWDQYEKDHPEPKDLPQSLKAFFVLLKAEFYPKLVREDARVALRKWHQKADFTKSLEEFRDLCTNIDNLGETEKLERFKEGLKKDYLCEVLRSKVKTFEEAVESATTWDLIQKQTTGSSSYDTPSNRGTGPADDPMDCDNTRLVRKGQMSNEERARHFEQGLCFRCHKTGHLSKDCPEKKTKKQEEKKEEGEGKE
jgi:hypothetical protein